MMEERKNKGGRERRNKTRENNEEEQRVMFFDAVCRKKERKGRGEKTNNRKYKSIKLYYVMLLRICMHINKCKWNYDLLFEVRRVSTRADCDFTFLIGPHVHLQQTLFNVNVTENRNRTITGCINYSFVVLR
jgi:hypothetical protein